MIVDRIPEIERLSTEEKLLLIKELWENIEGDQATAPADPDILEELDRRAAHYRQHPETAMSWDDFKRSIGKR